MIFGRVRETTGGTVLQLFLAPVLRARQLQQSPVQDDAFECSVPRGFQTEDRSQARH